MLEYLPGDRNFARNTQQSNRDALHLLVVFASTTLQRKPDELLVEDVGADPLRKFMRHHEDDAEEFNLNSQPTSRNKNN